MPVKIFCDKCGKEIKERPVRVIDGNQMRLYCPQGCFDSARESLAAVEPVDSTTEKTS